MIAIAKNAVTDFISNSKHIIKVNLKPGPKGAKAALYF
jgi:hypothetical protein